jgi:hypothetical protein
MNLFQTILLLFAQGIACIFMLALLILILYTALTMDDLDDNDSLGPFC